MGTLLHTIRDHQPIDQSHAAALAHYVPMAAAAVARSFADTLTARYPEHIVTLHDKALCRVRVDFTEDGPAVCAVQLEGAWLCPEDVLLPGTIDRMQAELARRFPQPLQVAR